MKNENKIIFIFTFFTVVLLVLISKKIIDIVLTSPGHTYIVENEYRDHIDLFVNDTSIVQYKQIEEQFDTDTPKLCPLNKGGTTSPDSCDVPNTTEKQHITNSDTEYIYIQHKLIFSTPQTHEEIELVEEDDNYDDSQLKKEDLVSVRYGMSITPPNDPEVISTIPKQGTEVTPYTSSPSETTSHYQEKIATDTHASQIRSIPKRFTKKFRSLSNQDTPDDIDYVAVLGMLGLPLYGLRLNGQGDTGSGNTTGGAAGGSSGFGGNGAPSGHLTGGHGEDEENFEEEHAANDGDNQSGGSLPPRFGTTTLVSSPGSGQPPEHNSPQAPASAPASLSMNPHDKNKNEDEDTEDDDPNDDDSPKSLMNPNEKSPEPGDDFEHIDFSDFSEKFVEFRAALGGTGPSPQAPPSQTGNSDASFDEGDDAPKPLMDLSTSPQPTSEAPMGPSDDSVPLPLKDLHELGGSTGFGPKSSRSYTYGSQNLLTVPSGSYENGYKSPRDSDVKKYMRITWVGGLGDEDGITEDVIIITETGGPNSDPRKDSLGEHRGQVQTSIGSNGPEQTIEEPQSPSSKTPSMELKDAENDDTFEQRGRSGTGGSDLIVLDSNNGSITSSVGGPGPFTSFLFIQPEEDETTDDDESTPSDKGSDQSFPSGSPDFEVLSKDSENDSPPLGNPSEQQDMENDTQPDDSGDETNQSSFSDGENTEEPFILYKHNGDGYTQQPSSFPPSDSPDGEGSPANESLLGPSSSGEQPGSEDTSIQSGLEESHYSRPGTPDDSDIEWPTSSSSSGDDDGDDDRNAGKGAEGNNNNNNNNNNEDFSQQTGESTSLGSNEAGSGQQHRGPINRAALVGITAASPSASGSSSGTSSSGGAPSPATTKTTVKATPPQRVATPPPMKRSISVDLTSYRNSIQALTQLLHAITQSSQHAMRSLSLAANTTYPDSSRFRIFGSASAKKPYPAKNQPYAMTIGAVMNPVSSFVTGLAYSHTRHSTQQFSSYGKSETSKGSTKGKLNAHHISTLLAWNTAGEGITSFLEYAYGLGEAKINRTFFYKQKYVTNKGKTRTYTDGGTMRLGYRFAVTEHVSVTPYGELAAVRSQWKEYTEHTPTLPATIYKTKEFTRERRLGIEGRWHVSPGIQFQAWGAFISSKKHNGHGINASMNIANQQQYLRGNTYTAHQKMGEFGAVFAIRTTPNFGIRFDASIRTKANAKTALGSQQVGTSMWYAF